MLLRLLEQIQGHFAGVIVDSACVTWQRIFKRVYAWAMDGGFGRICYFFLAPADVLAIFEATSFALGI